MDTSGGRVLGTGSDEASVIKLRALFLAALMVLSVFAGTIALTGTAAAANQADNTHVTIGEAAAGNVPIWVGATNDSTGPNTPQEGVDVTIEVTRPDGTIDTYTKTTGPDGNVNLPYPVATKADGEYTVTASAAGSYDERKTFTVGPEVVEIYPGVGEMMEVGRETNVTVAVMNNGTLASGVNKVVTVRYPNGKTKDVTVTTDADGFGTFTFTPNATGDYSFTSGTTDQRYTAGKAVAGVYTNNADFGADITPGGSVAINGEVYDEGTPYAGKDIVVEIVNDSASGDPVVTNLTTSTNAQGQFLATWSPSSDGDARYDVNLYTANGARIAKGYVDIDVDSPTTGSGSGGPTLDLDVEFTEGWEPTIQPGGSATLHVELTENGDPVSGESVVIGEFYGDSYDRVPAGRTTVTTNSTGEATLTVTLPSNAPLGTELLKVEGHAAYNGSTATSEAEANVQSYEVTDDWDSRSQSDGTVLFDFSATDPDTGDGVSGVPVMVAFETENSVGDAYPTTSATTGSDGTTSVTLDVPEDAKRSAHLVTVSKYLSPHSFPVVDIHDYSVTIDGLDQYEYAQGETVTFNYTADSSGNVTALVVVAANYEQVDENLLVAQRVAPGEDVTFTVPSTVPNGTDYEVDVRTNTESGSTSSADARFDVGGTPKSSDTSDTTAPTADAGSDESTLTGAAVSFDGSGSSDNVDIASYEWDFDGDGTTDATGETASHTYSSPGTYTVTLAVSDGAGNTDTDTVNVTVTDPESGSTSTPTPTRTPTPTPTDEPTDEPTEPPTDTPTEPPVEPTETSPDTSTSTGAPGFGAVVALLALFGALLLVRSRR